MPPLPVDRIIRHAPFESTGVDYLGPTLARLAGQVVKVWIVLLTCLTTRAVYLEPTTDLSAVSFLNVLRRFISRRGRPSRMLSDNGGQFVLADKTLKEVLPNPINRDVIDQMANQRIEWKFIPSLSPWSGGLYELLVGLTKSCFKRTLGRRILDMDQFATFTAEVEAVLNQRPISAVSGETDAPVPLRPVDFLHPKGIVSLDTGSTEKWEDERRLPPEQKLAILWKSTLERLDQFWERWSTEYLTLLRERAKWKHKGPRLQTKTAPSLGEVVLIEEDYKSRNLWPLGRVIQLNGSGTNVRSVQLKTANGRVLTRPVNRLYSLELGPEANQRPDESSTMHPSKEDESIKPTPPEQTTPEELTRHPMVTRSKGKQVLGTMMATISLMCLALPVVVANLTVGSKIECYPKGIIAFTPAGIVKEEICCEGSCIIRPASRNFTYELPPEVLLNDYTCYGNFWTSKGETSTVQTTCAATAGCEAIDCSLCIDHIANPHCRPRWAAVLTGLVMCFAMSLCCLTLCVIRACGANVRMIYSGIYYIIGCGIWGTRHARRKAQKAYVRADHAGLLNPLRRAKRKLVKTGNEMRNTGKEWRREHLDRIVKPTTSRYSIVIVAIAVGTITLAIGTEATTIAVVTRSESCKRGPNSLECIAEFATTMTFLPRGQNNRLLMRDEHGVVLGTLTIVTDALTMDFIPTSLGWMRSYTLKTLAVKRCPSRGSCSKGYCSKVRPQTMVDELKDANSFPGITRCSPSSSFWLNGCGLPADACFFYRYYAKPSSEDIFELFSCPSWEFRIHAQLILEISGQETREVQAVLHPGMSFNWQNITLTPLSAAVPPMPALHNSFITNGIKTAMITQIPKDLFCSTEEEAQKFNCSLDAFACTDCILDHSEGSASCSCRDADLNSLINNPTNQLPLAIHRIQLRNEHRRVYAEYGYSPIQVHVKMTDFQMLLEFRDAKCHVEVHALTGCYRCQSGAHLQFTCHTDHGTSLAKIECLDGTLFTAKCSKNGTMATEVIAFDHYEIDTMCIVDCPAGESQFNLTGKLYYVPMKRQLEYGHRDSENLDLPTAGSWWDISFDPRALLAFMAFPGIIVLTGTLLIGIIALYFFVRLNPAFRMWRMMARVAVISFIIHAVNQPCAAYHLTKTGKMLMTPPGEGPLDGGVMCSTNQQWMRSANQRTVGQSDEKRRSDHRRRREDDAGRSDEKRRRDYRRRRDDGSGDRRTNERIDDKRTDDRRSDAQRGDDRRREQWSPADQRRESLSLAEKRKDNANEQREGRQSETSERVEREIWPGRGQRATAENANELPGSAQDKESVSPPRRGSTNFLDATPPPIIMSSSFIISSIISSPNINQLVEMEPRPKARTNEPNKVKVDHGKRKADTCSRCLLRRPDQAVGHRACDKKCPFFEGGAKVLKRKKEEAKADEPPEKHKSRAIVSDDEDEPVQKPPNPKGEKQRKLVVAEETSSEDGGEVRDKSERKQPQPSKKLEQFIAIGGDVEEEEKEIREPEIEEPPMDECQPYLAPLILLESIGRRIDPRKGRMHNLPCEEFQRPPFSMDASVQLQVAREMAAQMKTIKAEMNRMAEETAARRAKEREKERKSDERRAEPKRSVRRDSRSAERRRSRRRSWSRGRQSGRSHRRDTERKDSRHRHRKEEEAKEPEEKAAPSMSAGALRAAEHHAKKAAVDIKKKGADEIPPEGRRQKLDSKWAKEIVRDTMEEETATDTLEVIDPRGKEGQNNNLSVREAREEEDKRREETREARDQAWRTFVRTETSLDKPRDKRNDRDRRRNDNDNNAREAATTSDQSVEEVTVAPSPVDRFLAGMVLECRGHAEQLAQLARQHSDRMEQLLFDYLKVTQCAETGQKGPH